MQIHNVLFVFKYSICRYRRLDGAAHSLKLVGGRYSTVASVTLRDADLPTPAEFICTLRIPQANYVVRKEAIYYPGKKKTSYSIYLQSKTFLLKLPLVLADNRQLLNKTSIYSLFFLIYIVIMLFCVPSRRSVTTQQFPTVTVNNLY